MHLSWVTPFLSFFFLFFFGQVGRDLSSPTRSKLPAPALEKQSLNRWPPGKFLMDYTLKYQLRNLCLTQGHKGFLPWFYFKIINIGFTLRPMIHSELTLLYGTGMVKFVFQHMDTWCPPKTNHPFSTELFCTLFLKIIYSFMCRVYFQFHWTICLLLANFYSALTIRAF